MAHAVETHARSACPSSHRSPRATEDFAIEPLELAHKLVRAALDKKAEKPVLLDVEGIVSYADYFLICSGTSTRQVQAIAEHIEKEGRALGVRPLSVEGKVSGRWVLMDFGAVVVHIFDESVRDFYDLEGLWSDAPRCPLPEEGSHSSLAAAQAQ